MEAEQVPSLSELARAHGVLTVYTDVQGREKKASADALLAILQGLGAPIAGSRDTADALRNRRQHLARRAVEPVAVAWDGSGSFRLCLPAATSGILSCTLTTEQGGSLTWMVALDEISSSGSV